MSSGRADYKANCIGEMMSLDRIKVFLAVLRRRKPYGDSMRILDGLNMTESKYSRANCRALHSLHVKTRYSK